MDRISTFWGYFKLFAISYIIISGLIYFATREEGPRDNKYTIEFDEPKLEIVQAKSKYRGGEIRASVVNDADSIINLTYLKFDFYDKEGKCVGILYQELKYFNVGETNNFVLEHNFKNVDYIKVSLADEEKAEEITQFQMYMYKMRPIAALVALLYLL